MARARCVGLLPLVGQGPAVLSCVRRGVARCLARCPLVWCPSRRARCFELLFYHAQRYPWIAGTRWVFAWGSRGPSATEPSVPAMASNHAGMC